MEPLTAITNHLQNCMESLTAIIGHLQNCMGLLTANTNHLQNCMGLLIANTNHLQKHKKVLQTYKTYFPDGLKVLQICRTHFIEAAYYFFSLSYNLLSLPLSYCIEEQYGCTDRHIEGIKCTKHRNTDVLVCSFPPQASQSG